MKKGKLLGSGVTAEVYEWGQDRVLKLYFNKFSTDDWVKHETKVGHIVNGSGLNAPIVYEEVEVDGRKGVIYQRIYGESIIQHIAKEPWKLNFYIQQTAVLHHNIHKFSAEGLPTQKEKFTKAIMRSSNILGCRTKKIIDYMESLPDGESICHGDLYCNNIIVSGKKLVPIDWNGAYTGNPLGDVARTCMIICSPSVPNGIPSSVSMLSNYPRYLAYRVYIDEYMKLTKVKFEDIDAWKLPVAAAKLKDKISREKKWLLNIIDKRLGQLNL